MSSTSGSDSWLAAGEAALGGVLSYEAGQQTSAQTTEPLTQPDIAGLYYGQAGLQPTVGSATASSSSTVLVIGLVVVAAVVAILLLKH